MSLKAQAHSWYVLLTTTDDPETVWCLFQIWWNASEQNRQAFREVEAALRGEDVVRLAAVRAPARAYGLPFALTAVVLIAGLVLFKALAPTLQTSTPDRSWLRAQNGPYDLPRDELLADQSIIRLAPDTVIQWKFTDKQRQFALERGRVRFTVHRDGRSFYVQAGATSVEAHGTVFSVAREKQDEHEEVWTLVSSGEVTVTPQPAAPVRTVKAGEALRVRGSEVQVERNVPASDARLKWTGDLFDFRRAPLPAVVAAFNEHNPQHLEIVDPRLAKVRVGGQFKGHDPLAFAQSLQEVGIAQVDQGGDPHSGVIRLRAPSERGTSVRPGDGESHRQ